MCYVELSNVLSRYDVKKAKSHVSVKFRGEVQSGGIHLRAINI